jgi:type VI secretion system protein ImpJ
MAWKNKVVWSEGMLLQPQHLQQHDRYWESQLESRVAALRPYGWGFSELKIDEHQLGLGKLALRACSGVLPDGTPFVLPADGELPLPLDVAPEARNVLVMLALPLRRHGVAEVRNGDGAENLARYQSADYEVWDSNGLDNSALLQVGQLRVRLALAPEVANAHAALGHRPRRRAARRQPAGARSRLQRALPGCPRRAAPGFLRRRAGRVAAPARRPAGRTAGAAGRPGRRRDRRFPAAAAAEPRRAPGVPPGRGQRGAPGKPVPGAGCAGRRAGNLHRSRQARRGLSHLPPRPAGGDLRARDRRPASRPVDRDGYPGRRHRPRRAPVRHPGRGGAGPRTAALGHLRAGGERPHAARSAARGVSGPGQDRLGGENPGPGQPAAARHRLAALAGGAAPAAVLCRLHLFRTRQRGSEYFKHLHQSAGFAMHVAGDFPGLQMQFWAIRR